MKKIIISIISAFLLGSMCVPVFAQVSRNSAKESPVKLLDQVVNKANEDHKIQETELDGVTSTSAGYSGNPQYRITNTLEYVKNNIHPYIQRIVYLGLTVATILLIYNGFLMVTNVAHDQGELSKIKNNFIRI